MSLLPSESEIPHLASQPGSVLWEQASDWRVGLLAGYALVLQVAHPTVAAGVREHSDFKSDPWKRLLRTLDFVYVLAYGRPEEAAEMGQRIRDMHKKIRGMDPDGKRYHALEPEAYAWVFATLAQTIVEGHRLFGRPLSYAQTQEFWTEWRALGRLLGVREQDLPAEWSDFCLYFERMIAERLEDNDVVHDVLATLAHPPSPSSMPGVSSLMEFGLAQAGSVFVDLTTGALPHCLRQRFGLRYTALQAARFQAVKLAMRASDPLTPPQLRRVGSSYVRVRRAASALSRVKRLRAN